jgi:hypothetical protein
MDLKQRKLTKSEWNSIEVPVSAEEKEILQLIIRGFHEVNLKYNKHNSLLLFLKIDYSAPMEDYLFNKFFQAKVEEIRKVYRFHVASVSVKTNPNVKKADIIRIEKNDSKKMKNSNAVEYVLLELVENVLKYKKMDSDQWVIHYFTLYKLIRSSIPYINRHVSEIVNYLLNSMDEELNMLDILGRSVEFIEKNEQLLRYSDLTLYQHQKQIFTVVKDNSTPKLILYIAPTGTGKTLTPIGLSEKYRVIFVCAARHVGLALARASISVGKKIAFAFGCASADDIRLHYFAAKEYKVNKRSGGIGKVDNSIGDKVEIMICDLKSYLPAMYYMKAFNEVEDIVVYWDEPTITMDYETHELHETISQNWRENLIPNMVLSSATLPKLHELTETISDYQGRFPGAEVYNIVSHDCKKSIPIINKFGYVVAPHYLSDNYANILRIVEHCETNLTLMRYLDLNEVVRFIDFVEKEGFIATNMRVCRHFASLDDMNMQNIKLHYLRVLKHIQNGETRWSELYNLLRMRKEKRILSNSSIDPAGNKIRKYASVGPGTYASTTCTLNSSMNSEKAGQPIVKMPSAHPAVNANANPGTVVPVTQQEEQCAIYITTKDAFTLTDGPTIFLANDVEKIARFYIQQANIPANVMEDIMKKIEFNNQVNERIELMERELEDLVERNAMKGDCADSSMKTGKKTKEEPKVKTATGTDGRLVEKMTNDLDTMRSMIKSAELNETFVPNKPAHLKKWAENVENITRAFTSDIDEETIVEIMLLKDVADSWKVLLLMGIGVFTNHPSIAYTEIMKRLADSQKLYMIIASSDYIYGTNYQFCHGYLSKDMVLTQEKIIQALGRIGRSNIQQNYSIRFRHDEQIRKLFYEETDKPEVRNMNLLFNGSA